MKTQISRNSHRPEKRYSGVYQQQGRMITDADWNELMQVVQSRLQEVLKDVIGSGVPNDGKGIRLEKDDSGTQWDINISAGHLYAEGVIGTLLEGSTLTTQAELPALPLPVLGGSDDYILYADLWERSITSLEDIGLLDAGLHGADTTTRTQTMVQIKWCTSAIDPESFADNPRIGNAPLSLSLRTVSELKDECDPCAIEIVQEQEYIGNYLFRLEVHEAYVEAGVQHLVLKWSSENGAEQHAVGNEPEEFTEGPWIYEFYNRDIEKYLGNHFAPRGADYPQISPLQEGYPSSIASVLNDPDYQHAVIPWLVRRWDGYCELSNDGSGWVLVAGKDKIHTLTTDPTYSGQDGYVELSSMLDAQLGSKSLRVEMELDGKSFVRGDYWLCTVREEIHSPGDNLLADALPEGVRHHYLKLAELQSDGSFIDCANDTECRRNAFPPLTDLRAGDVGYQVPDCPEEATMPPTVQSLLRDALSAWPDLDTDKRNSVKDVLDALLCELDAASLPYDPILQQGRWEDILDDPAAEFPHTVQQAIDDLIAKFESSDIVYEHDPAVDGACETMPYGADTLKKALDLDPDHDNRIKLNDILAALLCRLEADKIPYNATVTAAVEARWRDLLDDTAAPLPQQLQDAIDEILLKLESSDIWYHHDPARNGDCVVTGYGADTLKTALGVGDSVKLNNLLNDLLCLLDAAKIPYDPTGRQTQWQDLLDDTTIPLPTTLQQAMDQLVGNIESSDIGYSVPECTTEGDTSTLKDQLGLSGTTDLKSLWDTLLCAFNATDLPIEKNADLAGRLNVPEIVTVQDALNLLSNSAGGGCAVTVGEGGVYPSIADAAAGLATLAEVNLCLLPGEHLISAPLDLLNKTAIKLTGAGSAASRVVLNADLHLQADQVILRDLDVSTDRYLPRVILEGEQVEARSCGFSREVFHQPHLWSQSFSGPTSAYGITLAVDSRGDIIMTGYFFDSLDLGGAVLESKGGVDIFIAKFDRAGGHRWSASYGGIGHDYGYALAVDGTDNIYLSGWLQNEVDFGGQTLVSKGSNDIFLVKFDPEGKHLWSQAFGGSLPDAGYGLAADKVGNVVLTGYFQGAINFGGVGLESQGSTDIFLAKFGPDGKPLWAHSYGGASPDYGFSVAMDGRGDTVLVGYFQGAIAFGEQRLASTGAYDLFIAKFDPDGKGLWARSFGGTANDYAYTVATDRGGNVVLSGTFQGRVDFGGGDLIGVGGDDIYLLKLDPDGKHLWSQRYGGISYDTGRAVSVDRAGNVILTGIFQGQINFGGEDLVSLGGGDIYVAKFDPEGHHLWSQRYGGASYEYSYTSKVDAEGHVLLCGYFQGQVNFGGADLNAVGTYDAFLAKLDPNVETSAPLVSIASTDPNIETILHWSANRMSARITEPDREFVKVALALTNAGVGGWIEDNEIMGYLILQADLAGRIQAPLPVEQGVLRIGGGGELILRDNRIYHLATRYEGGAPSLDAYSVLQLTDNRFETLGNTYLAQSLTLSGNLFPADNAEDVVAIAVAERATIFGNQARNPDAILQVIMGDYREAANLLRIQSSRLAYYYPGYGYGFAEGIGADLL